MTRPILGLLATLILAGPSGAADAPVPAVKSTLATDARHIRQFAFDGDHATHFASKGNPGKDDEFTLRLDRAVPVKSVKVLTGNPDGTNRLDPGILEISGDGKTFEEVARFSEGTGQADVAGKSVIAIRVKPASALDHPIVIQEFVVDSSEAIPTYRYPIEFAVDVTDAPEMKDWADKVAGLCEEWYPRICETFRTEGDTPPTYVTMILSKGYSGVAMAGGGRITGSVRYFKGHPNDLGAMVHETVHIVQRYRSRSNPSWLVEGVADYFRFFVFEPGKAGPVNPAKAHYNDSYRTTATFLDYLTEKYDKQIVFKLNRLMRRGEYKESAFQDFTGKPLPQLGDEWIESLKK